MYLHIGSGCVLDADDLIGIFDMDNTTVTKQGRRFLQTAESEGLVIDICDDIPKSYIVAYYRGEIRVFVSSISTKTLQRRLQTESIIAE